MKSYKPFLLSILFFIVFAFNSNAQDLELDNLETEAIAKMKSLGFKFIEQVDGITNNESVLEFKQQKFIFGYSYIVISFFKKCKDCNVTIEFLNSQTKSVETLATKTLFNDTSYTISECRINESNNTFFYSDYSDKRGAINVFVNSSESHYLCSMLFFK